MRSIPLVMLVVTRPLSMTMPLWDVWQMVVIIMVLVLSHLDINVISLAMHNCIDHPWMITNVECWGCHLMLQWLREPSKSIYCLVCQQPDLSFPWQWILCCKCCEEQMQMCETQYCLREGNQPSQKLWLHPWFWQSEEYVHRLKNTVFAFEVCHQEGWYFHQWLSQGNDWKNQWSLCVVNFINMWATIYFLIMAILSLLEKNMPNNLGYFKISIFWVILVIHC